MLQQITISGNTPVPIRPLIESAIHSELRMLELSIERTEGQLRYFEEKYNMTSDEFRHRFETGNIDESLDFIEWFGEIKTIRILNFQRQALEEVTLN
jgi:hypothetical protein